MWRNQTSHKTTQNARQITIWLVQCRPQAERVDWTDARHVRDAPIYENIDISLHEGNRG